MLLLASLGWAVDLPVGAQIVVKAGEPLYDISGAQPVVPPSTGGWTAVVVADQGSRLQVKLAGRGCVAALPAASQMADVIFSVDEKSLLPLVTQQIGGRDKDGSSWTVVAGVPILSVDGGRATFPLERGSVAVKVEELPQALFVTAPITPLSWTGSQMGSLVPVNGSLGTFEGAPLPYPGSINVEPGTNGTVVWTNRCVRLEFTPVTPVPMGTAGIGGLLGGLRSQNPPIPLTLKDGTPAGTVRWLDHFKGPEEFVDTRRCIYYHFLDSAPESMEFCVPKDANVAETPSPFGSGGVPGGVPGAVPGSGVVLAFGEGIVMGSLDKSKIDAVIQRMAPQIRYCYQRESQNTPGMKGKVTIKFVIAEDGTVSSAVVKSSTLGNAAVEACVVKRIQGATFPAPSSGIVIAAYPFLFSPG